MFDAAPPPEPTPAVAEVVVRAARLPDPAGEAAFSVTRVDPRVLEQATGLDQALKTVPGFSLFRRTSTLGANPTTQGAGLRAIAGSGAGRALVTLDGVPQNDPFGGWVIWTALPSETVGGARIVRGAGSGPYGAGALTGVVQLDSRGDLEGIAGSASAGDLGYRQETLVAGAGGSGPTRVFADASGQESDGWIPVRSGRGAADRPLDLHGWSAAGRVEQDVGSAVLAARVAGYGEDRGAGVVGSGSRASGQQLSLTLAQPPTGARAGFRLQAWALASDLYNATASTSNARDTSTPANVQYATPAVGWGLNAAWRRLVGSASLEVGTDVRGATGETRELTSYAAAATGFTRTRKAGGQTLVAGAYVEASDKVGPWLLAAGARVDRWADMDGERVERVIATGATALDNRPADQDGVEPTARLGVKRELADGLALRTAAYAGFRPATLNELHRPFRVGNNLTESNPDLVPERLYGAEVGLDYAAGPFTAAATVFRNRLEDAVLNVTVGSGPATFPIAGFVPAGGVLRQRENAGSVDATGLEADSDLRLTDRLHLTAGLAYTYASVDSTRLTPQLEGRRPALTPRFTATAQARYALAPRLELALDARYESARFDDDLNTLRLRPALTFDARAEWRMRPGLGLFVAADNLLDTAVQTAETADGVYSYDAPRLVRVGLRLRR